MAKGIMIVDPQMDFISGSLSVPGAVGAMDALAGHLLKTAAQYALIIVTVDNHPWGHMSFTDNGGPWPRHCVAHSPGAALHEGLMAAIYNSGNDVFIIPKGERAEVEEYSAFQAAGERLCHLAYEYSLEAMEICGIAGDICVLQTLRDGTAQLPRLKWEVLERFSPSLDGGDKLRQFCQEAGICVK